MTSRLLTLLLLIVSASSFAEVAYVDTRIATDCVTYDPASRVCGSGSAAAYATFSSGLTAIVPGDELVLRSGIYDALVITRSGTPETPISIRGMDGELPIVKSSTSIGINIIGQTNVVIKNIAVDGVVGFGRVEESRRIVFENVSFSNATSSGTTGSLKFVRSTGNKVVRSSFSNGSDLLILQDNSNQNVLQDNSFFNARHSLISIRCSSQNVLRHNAFDNPDQKALEIYDCEGISDAPFRLNDTKRNVIEWNQFDGTKASSRSHDYNAIQHGGQHTIVRFNVFRDNLGGGAFYQYYSDESIYVYSNRLYNNTFYKNRCFAISGRAGSASTYYDNQVKNNLLYGNTDCTGLGNQIRIENPDAVILSGNSLADADPGFISASAGNFNLVGSSKEIDAGQFVTRARDEGSGITMHVEDASWFFDGFDIPNEVGDVVKIAGTSQTARIMAIDYQANTISFDRPLNWTKGDGIHTVFSGIAPDVGAFEFDFDGKTPRPPTDLTSE